MLMADLGAEVLLVEAPTHLVQRRPERTETAADDRNEGRRRAHNATRRNKRSIVLNLREQSGRDLLRRMLADADVVMEGFRPGVVQRLGVDYATVSGINPRIVYCSISGYGQDGPYRDLPGHDINYISAAGALASIGRPGQKPAIPLNLLGDYAGGGMLAAYSILAALLARDRTGRGQLVDIAMSDGVMYLMASAISGMLTSGDVPRPGTGGASGARPFYEVYETADGKYLSLGVSEPHFWENLCDVMGREDFKPLQYQSERYAEIEEHLDRMFRTKTRDEWFSELKGIDLCVAPVYELDEALADPHNQARRMVVEVDDPEEGTVRQVGIGPKFSDTPGSVHTTAPSPGQHTEEVLVSLGCGGDEIAALREQGVVA
jgi:crotonobetainyl-CoA:carnitine CoA-transferase CaiB-like acyl-CoA transferase